MSGEVYRCPGNARRRISLPIYGPENGRNLVAYWTFQPYQSSGLERRHAAQIARLDRLTVRNGVLAAPFMLPRWYGPVDKQAPSGNSFNVLRTRRLQRDLRATVLLTLVRPCSLAGSRN